MYLIVVIPKYSTYSKRYEEKSELYSRIDYALEEVLPEDASVTCTTFLLAHISERDVIYEVNYHKENGVYKADTEYIVLDLRPGYDDDSLKIAEFYYANGYVKYYRDEGAVLILVDENFEK